MTIQRLIETVQHESGMDISVYAASFLQNTLAQRVKETGSAGLSEYMAFLRTDREELSKLSDALHISYTLFFRNPLDVSILEGFVLPDLMQVKEHNNSSSLRIWSVGCAEGPEAFSLAMLADTVISGRDYKIPVMVFGTDICPAAVDKAREGCYDSNALQNARLSYIDRYFNLKKSTFFVKDQILHHVDFSVGDITDPEYTSPPAAIFADFDLVSCCNLLIYYHYDIQQIILEKLYHSLGRNGYLVVGESERQIVENFGKLRHLYPIGNIFVKNK